MSLQYIIDGCNIIHHPAYIKLNPDISSVNKDSRLALLEFIRLNICCGSRKNKVAVVFDGYPQAGGPDLSNLEINVIFSRGDTADEEIKRIIEGLKPAKNLIVVSDDNEIRYFARSAGAGMLGVEEFINKKKNLRNSNNEASDAKLTYAQMHKVNEELKKIWLK